MRRISLPFHGLLRLRKLHRQPVHLRLDNPRIIRPVQTRAGDCHHNCTPLSLRRLSVQRGTVVEGNRPAASLSSSSTTIATEELLARCKALYPAAWYIPAAVVLSCANVPDAIPAVFRAAASDLSEDQHALLARRMRDAIFKGGVLTGYHKAINSLIALHKSLPASLRADPARPERPLQTVTMDDIRARGSEVFTVLYGETAPEIQDLLHAIYPDMGFLSRVIAYGFIFGGAEHLLSPAETSFVIVAALIAGDTPLQVGWHLANARRIGASKAETQAVRQIAIECAQAAGVVWRNEILDVAE